MLLLQHFLMIFFFVVLLWKIWAKVFNFFRLKWRQKLDGIRGKSASRKGEIFIRSLLSRQLLGIIELNWVVFFKIFCDDEAPEIFAIHRWKIYCSYLELCFRNSADTNMWKYYLFMEKQLITYQNCFLNLLQILVLEVHQHENK